MEYMTESQVRKILEAEGYSPEEIDALIERATTACTINPALDFEALTTAAAAMVRAFEEMVAAIGEIRYTMPPEKQQPKPPRLAGPKNKGTPYPQRPARVARSCCRKMRR